MKNVEAAFFSLDGHAAECQLMLHAFCAEQSFEAQLLEIETFLSAFRSEHPCLIPVFKRYFLSDPAQFAAVEPIAAKAECAVSAICQPPLDGTKVALWVWMKKGVSLKRNGASFIETEGDSVHVWTTELQSRLYNIDQKMYSPLCNLYDATQNRLRRLADSLHTAGLTFADNCLRTWLFVRDIDHRYAEVVRARRDFFNEIGLTEKTHYIASTGIEGNGSDAATDISIDSLSIGGPAAATQRYLTAPDHLNPTHEYGVTFERATLVRHADRSRIYISGTASIDNRGRIVHEGDVEAQTGRMLENIEALLAEGGASFADVLAMTVYLRNAEDYAAVKAIFDVRFPAMPKVFVHAPICRPGWLVETECVAVKKSEE